MFIIRLVQIKCINLFVKVPTTASCQLVDGKISIEPIKWPGGLPLGKSK